MAYLPADLINRIHDNPLADWSQYRGSLGNVQNPHPQDIWGQYDEGGNAPQQSLDPNVWDANGRLRPELLARLMRDGVQYAPMSGQGTLDQGEVQFDPEFGLITPQDNNRPVPSGGIWDWLPMAAVGGAGVGAAMGAGAAGMGATAEGVGAAGAANGWTGTLPAFGTPGTVAPTYAGWQIPSAIASGAGAGAGAAAGAGSSSSGLLSGAGDASSFGGYTGGIDPNTAAGAGGMGSAQNGLGSGGLLSRLSGAVNNPSSLLSSNGLLGSAASAAMQNPLQAYGAAQSLGGLIGGIGRGASSSGGKSSGGAGLTPTNVQRPQYTSNPYLLAQLNRGY